MSGGQYCLFMVYNGYLVRPRRLANTSDEGFILMRISLDPVILSKFNIQPIIRGTQL